MRNVPQHYFFLCTFGTYGISTHACSRPSVYPLDRSLEEPPLELSSRHPDVQQRGIPHEITKLSSKADDGWSE